MAEILPIRRKTLSNQSINQSKVNRTFAGLLRDTLKLHTITIPFRERNDKLIDINSFLIQDDDCQSDLV